MRFRPKTRTHGRKLASCDAFDVHPGADIEAVAHIVAVGTTGDWGLLDEDPSSAVCRLAQNLAVSRSLRTAVFTYGRRRPASALAPCRCSAAEFHGTTTLPAASGALVLRWWGRFPISFIIAVVVIIIIGLGLGLLHIFLRIPRLAPLTLTLLETMLSSGVEPEIRFSLLIGILEEA